MSPTATFLDDVDEYLAILQPGDVSAFADLARHPAQAEAILRALEALGTSSITNGGGFL